MTDSQTERGKSLWQEAWAKLRKQKLSIICMIIIGLYAAVAIYGETYYRWYQFKQATVKTYEWKKLTPSYNKQNLDNQYQPPSTKHIFGTDNLGRDVAARLVQGTRVAFQVGIVTSLIAIPIGVLLGCLAGYFGGKVDDFIVWLYSTFASIPSLLFILAIAMAVGKGLTGIFLGIGLTAWVPLCRLIRAEVMKHRERAYVMAARALGFSDSRIIFRHILPNVTHIIIVNFTLRFPAAIGTEVIMSFLGIGVQGEPSWGVMINNARTRLWQGVWWEMTFATLAIFLLVLAFNLLGDALRDALDPRLRESDR